ncbi:MAG TPA: MBL fold metallo-hydrolase [Candidatus Thioglobus sp.]|jgi:glyoxylase-like metal-dependent hydrolase (beta-lactamase superfamily II)|nr:MBL fold metallo-hydrolase [Candidatus Thioglobus sp.]HIL43165.1 MBL fold metallo-hydrolase [Gammaproteobacteria bacterium]
MKKIVALAFLIALTVQATEYEEVTVNVAAKQISGSAYYVPGLSGAATEFEGFISNSGFIVTSEGVVVFDALGSPPLAYSMLKEIRKVTDKDIKLVIVSHYHADHIYGLQVFKDEGAKIWAPKGAWEYIDSETSENLLDSRRELLFPWVNDDTYLVEPDRVIDEDIEFSIGDHKFLINYFGKVHSDGDMSLLDLTNETFYSGDIIFEGRIPFVGDADILEWIRIIGKIRKIPVMYFIPGHGEVSDNPRYTIDSTYRYLNFLIDNFKVSIEDMIEFDVAYDAIDWSEFENENAFDEANRKNAFAVYLYLEKNSD